MPQSPVPGKPDLARVALDVLSSLWVPGLTLCGDSMGSPIFSLFLDPPRGPETVGGAPRRVGWLGW